MRAGEHVFEWSVAYDPTFCTLTLAQGEYLGPPQTVDGANRTASGSIPVAPASTGTLTLTSRRTTRGGQLGTLDGEVTCDNTLDAAYTAYQHIWIEDPVFLDVASDELWINYFSRPQLNCIQDGSYTHTAWWRASTGWQLLDYKTNYAYIAADRSYITTSVLSAMGNLFFCDPSLWTFTSLDPNVIKAFPDAWAVMEWNFSISGDCSSLLHFQRDRWVQ